MSSHLLQFRLEAWVARGALALLRILGPVRASALGGAVARSIGPWLPVSRIADINLRYCLPEIDVAARRRIVRGVWDSLGRTVAELPHVADFDLTAEGPGFEVVGREVLEACRDAGGPVILFSGHIACWEILPRVLREVGMPMASFYRAATNPAVDALIAAERQRTSGAGVPLFAKGTKGARAALAYLARGGRVGMLVDQKMNDGIAARLFGHPAMTAAAAATLALRLKCPLVPGHVERLGPARLRIVVEPPLPHPASGDLHADVATLTQAMNDCLERWIRARPQEWLWLHRRFPLDVYRR